MKICTLYHTGVYTSAPGVIKDHKVYLQGKNNELYFPERMFMAIEECEGGLIQFEVDGKWGFADIHTGEIIIDPVWDYAGPFYNGYAHVALGVEIDIDRGCNIDMLGGKHGYIGMNGGIVIPLDYDDAEEIPYKKYFKVAINGKWGLIDRQNKIIIQPKWDNFETSYSHSLIFVSIEEACELYVEAEDKLLAKILNIPSKPTCQRKIKWGVYDKDFNLLLQPELDEKPTLYNTKNDTNRYFVRSNYYILKSKGKYGVLCEDGRLITNITLLKREAITLIEAISR